MQGGWLVLSGEHLMGSGYPDWLSGGFRAKKVIVLFAV
jgi:hypothetical protein